MSYRTPALIAQANEMKANFLDWHPTAQLPAHLMLVAYADGIWLVTADAILSKAQKVERICDSWR